MIDAIRLQDLRTFAAGEGGRIRSDVRFLLEQLDSRDETIRKLIRAKQSVPRIPKTIHEIVKVVSDHTGAPVAAIFGRDRHKSIARARHACMLIARTITTYSFPEIGQGLGGRDHTTVMSGCERARLLYEKDPGFAVMLEACYVALEPKPGIVDAIQPDERVRVAG